MNALQCSPNRFRQRPGLFPSNSGGRHDPAMRAISEVNQGAGAIRKKTIAPRIAISVFRIRKRRVESATRRLLPRPP